MSEFTKDEHLSNAGTRSQATKASKPFCSLAYLAKSTIAINGNNDIRIVNGNSNNKNNNNNKNSNNCQPNVAATAKVNERGSPGLPIGAATAVNGHCNQTATAATTPATAQQQLPNGNHKHCLKDNHNNGATTTTTTHNNGHSKNSSISDVFGIINEEDQHQHHICTNGSCDAVDGDLARPWELKNGSYVQRIPPSLMTSKQQQQLQQHQQLHQPNSVSSICSTALQSKLNSLDCWDYTIELECLQGPEDDPSATSDLQLAAELGKTLLERNKELETSLKEHKSTIEEQEQEIVYLKKHTTALREVNDSRLKVYEQLEVGIQDLERANHRLLVENTSDKKHIKTLTHTIETLEARSEDLNKQLEETRQSLNAERRKNERLLAEKSKNANEALKLKPAQNSNGNGISEAANLTQFDANTTAPENCSFAFQSPADGRNNANSTGIGGMNGDTSFLDMSMVCGQDGNEEIIKLVNDLESTKKAFVDSTARCGELEEQLVAIIQENQTLQSRIAQTSATEEMKSMHDELSILDEVRQGQMCSRCLRSMDDRITVNDEQSSLAPTEECEEDEERSLLDLEGNRDDNASISSQAGYHAQRAGISIKVMPQHPDSLDLNVPGSPNPYRDLVEKYEALLEVQRSSIARKSNNGGGMSLAEEFQSSGEFTQTQKLMFQAAHNMGSDAGGNCGNSTNGDASSSCNGSMTHDNSNSNKSDKNRGRTPTEFSEAETSSSGFSDETSNKGTQTEERAGYFLCSIGDGEDCKFSIYDDASPIDSRFRNRPEYRELFKEIFAVLKKAAENKEEGDKLPLLDDTHPNGTNSQKVPPVTPANEELPADFGDDTQSIISSAVSEQSFAMSECITKLERKTAKKHIIEKNQENQPPLAASVAQLAATPNAKQIIENGRVLTPLKREPLDYLAVGVGIKKKNRRKNRNFSNDRSESPLALPTPPRIFVASGKKRKEMRPFVDSPAAASPEQPNTSAGSRCSRSGGERPKYEWNGNSMIIYNRSLSSRGGRSASTEIDYANMPYRPSTVSQDLHKLKKLDLSYAEVLRRADACKQHHHQQQQQQQQRRRNHHRH